MNNPDEGQGEILRLIKCAPLIGTDDECSRLKLTRKRSRAKQDLSQGTDKLESMVAQSPNLVGIVGGSCAGKTWLAEQLRQKLGEGATHISLDDFYRDRAHLSLRQRSLINFDHPRAIDWERVEQVLKSFAAGNPAPVPTYDFHRHGRMSRERTVAPGAVVIMDGLWLFRRASIRNLFAVKIFIRSSREWCEKKRLARDTAERGRTSEQVKAQLNTFTFPMFERFVAPQERWADKVLESPIAERAVQDLAEEIYLKSFCVGI